MSIKFWVPLIKVLHHSPLQKKVSAKTPPEMPQKEVIFLQELNDILDLPKLKKSVVAFDSASLNTGGKDR